MKQFKMTNGYTNRESEAFNKYLTEINRIKPFKSSEEELETAIKAGKGDINAYNDLIEKNLRFVVSVAKQYATDEIKLEDLVNEGNWGLMVAAKRFDEKTKFKFISYAIWYIRKYILEYVSNHSKIVRFPANKVALLIKLEKRKRELEQLYHRDITLSEVYTENPNDFGDLDNTDMIPILEGYSSKRLDTPLNSGVEDCSVWYDVIADTTFKNSDDELLKNDTKKTLNYILTKTLKEKDKLIIEHIYGLNGVEQMSLDTLAEKLNMSSEGVRQIRNKSLSKLRKINLEKFL